MADKLSPIDVAARVSHRHLIFILGFMLLLGVAALLRFASPALAKVGNALWVLMPLVITAMVGTMVSMQKRVDKDSMIAVQNDELRRASLQNAWRNGLFVTLALQPLLAVAFTFSSLQNEVAVMAAVTVITGSITVLASLIWYDR